MNTSLDQFGVTERKGVPIVSSRKIADIFNKEHKTVLRTISEKMDSSNDDFAAQFCTANFIESSYKDRGKKYPEYLLTRDGFSFIVMGFTGKKADRFKMDYIHRFNKMESFIQSLTAAKLEFPYFTSAIMDAHDDPKHYHFSNEINMINKIVIGMDAKKFKEANGLGEVGSIRPYLNQQQIYAIEMLQKFDTGLIVTEPEFNKRKEILTTYYNRITTIRALKEGA